MLISKRCFSRCLPNPDVKTSAAARPKGRNVCFETFLKIPGINPIVTLQGLQLHYCSSTIFQFEFAEFSDRELGGAEQNDSTTRAISCMARCGCSFATLVECQWNGVQNIATLSLQFVGSDAQLLYPNRIPAAFEIQIISN
jgi:hypothetical protein